MKYEQDRDVIVRRRDMYNANQLKIDLDTIFLHRAKSFVYGFSRIPLVSFGDEMIVKVFGEFQRLYGSQFEPFTTLEMEDPLAQSILKEVVEYDQ